jgi:DNA-binding XRE family transcriptional regulator
MPKKSQAQNLKLMAVQIRTTARKKIKALQEEQAVSQRELGRVMEITGAATINQLLVEEGDPGQKTLRWTMDRALAVARHLKVSMDYLFDPRIPAGNPQGTVSVSQEEAVILGRVRELGAEESIRRLNLQVGRVYGEAPPAAEAPGTVPKQARTRRDPDNGSRGVGGKQGG